MSTKLVTIEFEKPLPRIIEGAENYDRVWVVVMRAEIPVGYASIDNCHTPIFEGQLRYEIVRQLGRELIGTSDYRQDLEQATELEANLNSLAELQEKPELLNLLAELNPKAGQTFFLSVIVCTRDRPQDLDRCLGSLVKLHSGRHQTEIIVVDNNPTSGQTEPVVQKFPQVRYETELRPGVAYARNQGLKAAAGDIVAYIDDDVVVPADWPQRILAPFADERVMCVSGLVLPLELETNSQEMFERYGGLGRGFKPRVFNQEFFNRSKRHVVTTWDLGGTANVAIRKSVIAQTGMFDETLGPGLPTGVGEDIYMFYRILKFGHLCYYEPAAYVWHKHRNSLHALKKQLYNYSKGQTSYQLRTLVSDGDRRVLWQLFWDLPIWHLKRLYRIGRGSLRYPLSLVWEEVRGNVVGPFAFYKAVKMHKRLNGPGTNPIKSLNSNSFT